MPDSCSATILSSPGCSINEHMVSPGLPSPPPMTIEGLEFRNNFETCFGSIGTLESHVMFIWGTWFAMSGTKKEVLTPGILVNSREIRSSRSCHSFSSAVVVFLQIELDRFHHSDNFFFANLLAAAQCVFMRTVVEQGIRDQILSSDQQAGALRATHRFSSTESDEIVSHVGVIPEMGNRRRVGGGIIHARNVVLLGQFDPFIHLDLTGGVREV